LERAVKMHWAGTPFWNAAPALYCLGADSQQVLREPEREYEP
jgi:hypothetical protein